MIDEALKSIHAQLYERAVSPLTGSFIISWLLWNHEILLIIFSSEKIQSKLSMIDEVFNKNITYFDLVSISQVWTHGILFPILTTFIYIFIYPIIAIPAFEFSRKTNKKLIEIKKKHESEQLMSVEDGMIIRSEVNRLKYEYNEMLSQKDAEIEDLKDRLSKNLIRRTQANSKENRLAEELEKTLIFIFQQDTPNEDLTKTSISNEIQRSKYLLEELINLQYIKYTKGTDFVTPSSYELTQKGRKYIYDNNLE